MDTLFGLPAHPFLVHIPIVLLPLAAIGVALMVIKRRWYERFRWPVLVIGAIGTAGAILAASAGEELERRIVSVEGREAANGWAHHAELGETARNVSIVFFVLLAAFAVVPWLLDRRRPSTNVVGESAASMDVDVAGDPHRGIFVVLAALAVLAAAGTVTTIIQAGHTGSKSVWEDVVADKGG